jgi:alginate O-acetyltransferase complex protein AlgI
MLLVVLGALAAAPVYWLVVPDAARRSVLVAGSLVGLVLLDVRAVALVLATAIGLAAVTHAIRGGGERRGRALGALALAGLLLLFLWNKRGGTLAVLPSQTGAALVGVSYLVLKAAAAVVDAMRGAPPVGAREATSWLAFLPTYTAGPIEELEHHRRQTPAFDRRLVLGGLERILLGLVKALVVAHHIGAWSAPVIAVPDGHHPAVLALGLVGATLRFYLDFSGYSDVAIGLGAVFGYRVEENFDRPLLRRNLVQLWQRWHMTLTRWLRVYLFVPASRALLRAPLPGGDRTAVVAAQLVTMLVCGLWHGLTPGFAVWGLLHGAGLAWVGVFARDAGDALPPALVAWWRTSPVAAAASTALTFAFFAGTIVFAMTDMPRAWHFLGCLVGAAR